MDPRLIVNEIRNIILKENLTWDEQNNEILGLLIKYKLSKPGKKIKMPYKQLTIEFPVTWEELNEE